MNHDSVAPQPNRDHAGPGAPDAGNYAFDSLHHYQPTADAAPLEFPAPGAQIDHHAPPGEPAPVHRGPAGQDPAFMSRRQALATCGIVLAILVVLGAVVYALRLPGADGF